MKYNDYNNNDKKDNDSVYDYFNEDPYTYIDSSSYAKAVQDKYYGFKRRTLVTAVVVGVLTLVASLLLTIFLVQMSEEKMKKQLDTELETYKSVLVSDVMKNLDYKFEVSEGSVSLATAIANKMVGSVVEVYCYQSAASNVYNATATAMVINDEGYMITNAHVVTYETRSFFQGRTITNKYAKLMCFFKGDEDGYPASVISYDTEKDLAIIRFEENPVGKYETVTFALDDGAMMGEDAIVIGNAEGLGISLTTGVVSNTAKEYDGVFYIQTDCAINPGNSGGPLYNSLGYCLGVVTSKISSSANEGLGFAITADTVIDYLNYYNEAYDVNVKYSVKSL